MWRQDKEQPQQSQSNRRMEQEGGRVRATEKFRKLLDELGVKWTEPTYEYWELLGIPTSHYVTIVGGKSVEEAIDGTLAAHHLTPEQAVAATLGLDDAYTREECEASFVRGYSLGSLPSGSDPQWDENRQTVDEHMAELGWVRKDAATARDADTSRWHELFGTPEWAELQSQLAEAERRAAMFERVAEDQTQRNRDMRNTVNAVTDADAESRWHELFGTPERAARTLANNCHRDGCIACPALDADCNVGDYDKLLEWLRGDA
jgi:hypothetical protein